MSQISSIYAIKAIGHAPKSLSRETLMQLVCLPLDAPEDVTRMVSEDNYCTLLETIAHAEGDSVGFHIKKGASMRCEDLGAAGLAWRSSRNILDGFERAERYVGVLGRHRMIELSKDDKQTTIIFHRTTDETRVGAKLSNETAFPTITAICREVSKRDFKAVRVLCSHTCIGDVAIMEEFLQCPVIQGAGINAMIVENEELRVPNANGDKTIVRFLDHHLSTQLSEIDIEVPLNHLIKIEIAKALSAGIPKISDIASALGMGTRTLQRRLSQEEIAYQSIVDQARRELAERLLRSTNYPLIEVAFLTGFSEQSSFTRAFKRWAGQTPRSYRLGVASD